MKKIMSMCLFYVFCFSFAFSYIASADQLESVETEIPEFMKASQVISEEHMDVILDSQSEISFDVSKMSEYKVIPMIFLSPRDFLAYWERNLTDYKNMFEDHSYVVITPQDTHLVYLYLDSVRGEGEKLRARETDQYRNSLFVSEFRSVASQMYFGEQPCAVSEVCLVGGYFTCAMYYVTDRGTFVKYIEFDEEEKQYHSILFTEEAFRAVRQETCTEQRDFLEQLREQYEKTGELPFLAPGFSLIPLLKEAGIEFEYAVPGNPIPEQLQPKAAQDPTTPEKSSWNGWLIGCIAAGVLGIVAMAIPVFLRKRKAKSPATEMN